MKVSANTTPLPAKLSARAVLAAAANVGPPVERAEQPATSSAASPVAPPAARLHGGRAALRPARGQAELLAARSRQLERYAHRTHTSRSAYAYTPHACCTPP